MEWDSLSRILYVELDRPVTGTTSADRWRLQVGDVAQYAPDSEITVTVSNDCCFYIPLASIGLPTLPEGGAYLPGEPELFDALGSPLQSFSGYPTNPV